VLIMTLRNESPADKTKWTNCLMQYVMTHSRFRLALYCRINTRKCLLKFCILSVTHHVKMYRVDNFHVILFWLMLSSDNSSWFFHYIHVNATAGKNYINNKSFSFHYIIQIIKIHQLQNLLFVISLYFTNLT
jgi:hypothetical protein